MGVDILQNATFVYDFAVEKDLVTDRNDAGYLCEAHSIAYVQI